MALVNEFAVHVDRESPNSRILEPFIVHILSQHISNERHVVLTGPIQRHSYSSTTASVALRNEAIKKLTSNAPTKVTGALKEMVTVSS
ncbi:unnamed protein product [Haemonchus placei]|uniref:Actin-related protein 2/3 complex subunit 4 n=1 Tax=Haemonchus placei TaxID=6290 RepID=A0A0N4WVT7_HAEPC|nr:unnamed protein product [Haemonchus placei]